MLSLMAAIGILMNVSARRFILQRSKCSHLRQEPEAPYIMRTSRGLHRIIPRLKPGIPSRGINIR